MGKNNVIELVQPGEFTDHLTEILRQGAQKMILEAVEAEIEVFLKKHADEKLEDGRQRVVRHGHGIGLKRRDESGFSTALSFYRLMSGAPRALIWRFPIFT